MTVRLLPLSLTITGLITLACMLVAAVGSRVNAEARVLAFSSYRDGNYEIYLVDIRYRLLHNLTRNPADDISPVWSPQGGRLAFTTRRVRGAWTIHTTTTDGEAGPLPNAAMQVGLPAWRFDGTGITYLTLESRRRQIDLFDYNDGTIGTVHTAPPYTASRAVWSPDGDYIAFAGSEGMDYGVYMMTSTGDDIRQIVTQANPPRVPNTSAWRAPAWSPDSQHLVYSDNGLWIIDRDGTNAKQLTTGMDGAPAWSPDGQKIAYMAADRGNWDIFVFDLKSGEATRITRSRAADTDPHWRP